MPSSRASSRASAASGLNGSTAIESIGAPRRLSHWRSLSHWRPRVAAGAGGASARRGAPRRVVIFARARVNETPRGARQAAEFARREVACRPQILFQLLQRAPQIFSCLITPGAILGEHTIDQTLQLGGEGGLVFGERGRLLPEQGRDNITRRLALKWAARGDHLVKHNAEAEDVRPRVGLKPARLLR